MATSRKPASLKPLSLLAWKLLRAMAKPYGHLPHEYPGNYPALSADREGRFIRARGKPRP